MQKYVIIYGDFHGKTTYNTLNAAWFTSQAVKSACICRFHPTWGGHTASSCAHLPDAKGRWNTGVAKCQLLLHLGCCLEDHVTPEIGAALIQLPFFPAGQRANQMFNNLATNKKNQEWPIWTEWFWPNISIKTESISYNNWNLLMWNCDYLVEYKVLSITHGLMLVTCCLKRFMYARSFFSVTLQICWIGCNDTREESALGSLL